MSPSSQNRKIKAVLFDLGKVILDFNFKPAFRRLSKVSPHSISRIKEYFANSGLEVLYDGGKISSRQFYREVKKVLRHRLDYAGFKEVWNDIFTPNPPIIDLVRRLAGRTPMLLISNTNSMHFHHVRRKYPVIGEFDGCILSFREKVRKPDRRIYRKAIRMAGTSADRIFYVDDRSDLTAAASSIGMKTFTYKNNPRKLVKVMKSLEIL